MKTMTAEKAKRIWRYDPATGDFFWLIQANQGVPPGNQAGCLDERGYLILSYKNRRYKGHRMAWLMMTGSAPLADVDHRDRNKSNNRFRNLREATRGQNVANAGKRSTNTSGFKGVSFHKKTGRWPASICSEGKLRYLGLFDTSEMAYGRYCAAARATFGDFAGL